MKKYILLSLCLGLLGLVIFSCQAKNKNISTPTPVAESVGVEFLDSLTASRVVLIDESNHIFERLTKLDMCIQMKGDCKEGESRANIMKRYKNYLQRDVGNFTEDEIMWMGDIWQEAVTLCNALNKAILPTNVQLIKSKGTYYGDDAFYTRENTIVIPENRIAMREREAMLSVMLHEIFHIYSRLHPDKQEALYALIGFKRIGDSQNLNINNPLQERILTNPDGPNFAYAIDLKSKERIVKVVPIISSTLPAYTDQKKAFFDYLYFDLFEVVQNKKGTWNVLSDSDGKAMVPDDAMTSFFDQIKYNTQYIIHPDEILADNFMILAMYKKYPDRYPGLSEDGLVLLDQIKSIL
jgi:hypothetical protein